MPNETTTQNPPTFNPETQKQLARLLATENITVQFGNYETAFFDVKNRVLGLPSWNFDAKYVSDLLIGHEVSHALHTPKDGIDRFKARFPGKPFAICNIIEDIRIERLILALFPGLVIVFKHGYEHLVNIDIFQIKGKDPASFGFADRLNIRSKTRRTDLLPLSEDDEKFYRKCLLAETFDDVLDLCEEAFNRIEDEKQTNPEKNNDGQDQDQGSEEGGEDSDTPQGLGDPGLDEDDQEQSDADNTSGSGEEDGESDGDTTEDGTPAPGDQKDGDPSNEDGEDQVHPTSGEGASLEPSSEISDELREEFESKTQDAFNSGLTENQHDYGNTVPIEAPSNKELLENIIDIKTLRDARRESPNYEKLLNCSPDRQRDWVDFKNRSKKHVAILAKEFERRKAAYQYSRATVARTGQLDVNRLHTYKYDDQIFRSVTRLADAKNHGMIFVIDYSGSMNGQIKAVISQTLQLVFFCKQVGIPFEVYAFTTPIHSYGTYGYNTKKDLKPGNHIDFDGTQVVELLNSRLKKNDFETAMKELWIQNRQPSLNPDNENPSNWYGSQNPLHCKYEEFGGTPLDQTLFITHAIVDRFRKENRVQKTNVIILTDGDGGGIGWNSSDLDQKFKKETDSRPSWSRHGGEVQWRGKTVELNHNTYTALIRSLREIPQTKVIGFFITRRKSDARNQTQAALRNRGKKDLIGSYYNDWEKISKDASKKKLKFYEVPEGFGYDAYYVLKDGDATNIQDDNLLDDLGPVDAGSAKERNALARTFAKQSGDKKNTRVFLQKFAELIA